MPRRRATSRRTEAPAPATTSRRCPTGPPRIAYAHHLGKTVLVAGTTDQTQPVATLVVPPAVVRPVRYDEPWFRARGGGTACLPWWGIRHDAAPRSQGYSR